MAGGYKNIQNHPNAGKSTFKDRKDDINRDGRPLSITNTLKTILSSNGEIRIPPEQIARTETDGSVIIIVPKQETLAMAIMKFALKGDMRAIQLIVDRIDGKAKQEIDLNLSDTTVVINPK